VFIPTTAQQFDRKIHLYSKPPTCYGLFSAIIREAFDRQIEKPNSD